MNISGIVTSEWNTKISTYALEAYNTKEVPYHLPSKNTIQLYNLLHVVFQC
jgi:hypothetical protein